MVMMNARDRIIIPVDTNDIDKALEIVRNLRDYVGMFKFGLEFLTSIIVQLVMSSDVLLLRKVQYLFRLVENKLFWDGKWDDIPNTISGAAIAVSPLMPAMVNVHASSGFDSIVAAVKNSPNSQVLGVTVLTSIDSDECFSVFGENSNEKVVHFAEMIKMAGADGIICSPKELSLLADFPNLIKVTPGVRPLWAALGDQKRVMTPAEAIAAGADYLVIGRPITNPPAIIGSPIDAVNRIVEEIGG